MLEVDLEAIPCGSQASTTAHWNGLQPSFKTGFWSISQIWTNKCDGNGMVMDPYAHPQQMNAFKHLVYA
jgi:hypothetical protein